jgi:DNA-binding MarR family transcriptional regulator
MVGNVLRTRKATERIGFLLARHGAITDRRIREAIATTGLTPRSGFALMHLAEAGPTSQQALIEALGVDPSVVVGILNDLEDRGLAERRRDPADRRRHIVRITRSGSSLLTKVDRALGAVERELFADLDDKEIARLHDLLGRIRTAPDDPACGEH